jgi:hypothetical protein
VKKLPDLADDIITNINSLAGCKTLIKSLNKEQAKNYPWKFVNSKFHHVFGKMKYPNGRELFNQDLFLLAYLSGWQEIVEEIVEDKFVTLFVKKIL